MLLHMFLAGGIDPGALGKHLHESTCHAAAVALGAGSFPALSTQAGKSTVPVWEWRVVRETKTAGAEGSGSGAEACCLATTEETLEK